MGQFVLLFIFLIIFAFSFTYKLFQGETLAQAERKGSLLAVQITISVVYASLSTLAVYILFRLIADFSM